MKLTEKIIEHIKTHQNYPATKAELVAACNNLMDFTDDEKKAFASTLPDKTFGSAQDVITALG